MIDRPMRPLFPEDFRNEVQVVNTVLSVDPDSPPEMPAMLGSSLATCISEVPFNGPIAGVKVGRVDGKLLLIQLFKKANYLILFNGSWNERSY